MPSNPRPRVLCVDDDEDSRLLLITLLKSALIEVKAVGTAAQALSSMQTERFDLYLLDGSLPDLDGFELCRRMRDLDPDTPILFFSGAANEADRKRGIEAGADGYVIKPDLEGLLGLIKQFVPCAEGPRRQSSQLNERRSLRLSPLSRPTKHDLRAIQRRRTARLRAPEIESPVDQIADQPSN